MTQDGTSWKPIGVRRVALSVLGLTLAAAILRFATLDVQSYWFDEALTVNLTHGSFGHMLDGIRAHEANPPLYYTLARFWSRLFGDGEVGLRSLSALAGTLTVPVAYAAGNSLVDRRTGLIVATLAAFSPALVWYSQEARAYALLVFFCALSLLFFAQARAHGRPASFAAWALTSALALWTHYFAVFLLAPEAVLLLAQAERRRAAIAAIAVVVAAGALVAPLALDQRTNGGGGWIAGGNFVGRAVNVPFFFAGGVGSHRLGFLLVVAVGLASAAALYAVWRAPAGEWRAGALVALGLGAACLAIPAAGKVLGSDYVLERNLLPAWLPLATFLAAGLGLLLRPRVLWGALSAVAVAYLAVNVAVARSPGVQRDDWRAVAQTLGRPAGDRVVAVAPWWQEETLGVYRPRLVPMRSARRAREIVTLTYTGPLPFASPLRTPVPGPPFRRRRRLKVQRVVLTWYAAPTPAPLTAASLARPGANGGAAFVEDSARRR